MSEATNPDPEIRVGPLDEPVEEDFSTWERRHRQEAADRYWEGAIERLRQEFPDRESHIQILIERRNRERELKGAVYL